MKRYLKKAADEKLCEWIDRLAPECVGMDTDQIHEILREVSVKSYIAGSNDAHTSFLKNLDFP